MNNLMKRLLARLQAPADDDGADAGGAGTGDQGEAAAAEDRGDVVSPELTEENLQAVVSGTNGDDGAAGDADGGGAADAGDEDPGQGGNPGIPKARFNEVNEQRKAAQAALAEAEAEIARLKASSAQAQPSGQTAAAPATQQEVFDEDAKEQAYMEAMIEGDTKKAAGIRKEINAHIREQATVAARQEAERLRQADLAQSVAKAMQAETALALEAYPYLDTEAGAEAVELIIAARDAKIAKGVSPQEALRAAVNTIAPKFAPAAAGTPTKDGGKAAPAVDSRPAAAVSRGAAASVAQPPALQGGVGERANAGRVNVEQMTDDQFDALSDADKRKLRGD